MKKIKNSFARDNQKTRRKVRKQQEFDIDRKWYAETVRNIDGKGVSFSLIYANSIEGEKSDSFPIESSLLAL